MRQRHPQPLRRDWRLEVPYTAGLGRERRVRDLLSQFLFSSEVAVTPPSGIILTDSQLTYIVIKTILRKDDRNSLIFHVHSAFLLCTEGNRIIVYFSKKW